jgi:hypothetical protein
MSVWTLPTSLRITCAFTESTTGCAAWFQFYDSSIQFVVSPFLFVDVTSTLKLAMRKVSVKSTFENFKTQCATEISSSCPAGSLAVDPTAAVGVAPEPATADFQPPKPREHEDGKPPMRGPGRRRLHRHEASSSDEERGVSRKDLKGINHLST